MMDSLVSLAGSPVPNVLVVAGIIFLLLAVAGKIGAVLSIPAQRQAAAAVIGIFLLAGGIALFAMKSHVPAEPGANGNGTNGNGQGQTHEPAPAQHPPGIAGRYTMDQQRNRIIMISRLAGNEYRIEETTSPWPWTGTATLNGTSLSGRAHFPRSQATMKVEGSLRGDGSIAVEYHFITKGDGSLAEGRVDRHVWFPE